MNIILTGALGNISKPLAEELVQKGHSVTVISSKAERRQDIEVLGAKAAIGSIDNVEFLAKTLNNADAIYCMTPPNFRAPDQLAYYKNVAECYVAAIRQSGVKRVVYLSSYGAHLSSGTGFITGSYLTEQMLNTIPDIALTHIRPTYFYYNLLGFIPMIKSLGFIGAVYGGEDKLPMVSPLDIAKDVAEEMSKTENIQPIRYVCSDEMTCSEVAGILGQAIGIPHLQWRLLPADTVKESLLNNGVPPNAASNLIELGLAFHSGRLREDYDLHKPSHGKIKLVDFVKEFAAVYNQQAQ